MVRRASVDRRFRAIMRIHANFLDIAQITDLPLEEVRCRIRPWYRMCAQELLAPVKQLAPSDEEM